jgi:O-antigen/teichoic acid export membrane protein
MSIGRNSIYNLVSTLVPTVLALVTVPLYLKAIGPERYGVLAIAWLILGYFGVFDLGLGRATTQKISSLRDAAPKDRSIAFGTAMVSNLAIGAIGAAVLWPASVVMFQHEMKLEPALRQETMLALPLLALAVPVATTLGVLSGALMAREKFAVTSRISITNTILFQILPLAVAWIVGPHMLGLLASSIAARLVGLALYWRECAGEFGKDALRRFDRGQLRELLHFGGWVTVAQLFNPFIVMLDRFVIGALLGSYPVTVYVVPNQLTTRVSTVSNALISALFPRLAIADGAEAARLARDGVGAQLALLTAPIVGAFVLLHDGLALWVGARIAGDAAALGRLMLVTAWLNMSASVAFSRLQARGRPDLVTKTMLAQLPFFVVGLYFAVLHFGVVGAAWAMFVRTAVDLVVLDWFSARRIDHGGNIVVSLLLFAGLEYALAIVPDVFLVHIGLAIAGAVASLPLAWQAAPTQLRDRVWNLVARLAGWRRRAITR